MTREVARDMHLSPAKNRFRVTITEMLMLVALGGILTSLPSEMMTWRREVDVGVIGEAYGTFPEILEMVDEGGREWTKIRGTISRGDDGKLMMSGQRPLIQNLDDLPYPAWDLFPLEDVYFDNSAALFSEEGMLASRRLDINASYGCSLICRFCYHLGIAGDMRMVRRISLVQRVAWLVPDQ